MTVGSRARFDEGLDRMAKDNYGEELSPSGATNQRGRDTTTHQVNRRRDKSMSREALGVAIGEIGEKLERVEHAASTLENHMFGELEEVKKNLSETDSRLIRMEESLTAAIQGLREDIEGMNARFTVVEEDVALCKKAAANRTIVPTVGVGRVDFRRPSRFNGVRDAKEVENFLRKME